MKQEITEFEKSEIIHNYLAVKLADFQEGWAYWQNTFSQEQATANEKRLEYIGNNITHFEGICQELQSMIHHLILAPVNS